VCERTVLIRTPGDELVDQVHVGPKSQRLRCRHRAGGSGLSESWYILDEAGQQVEEAIRTQGGEATYVHLDVTRETDWVEAVGTALLPGGVASRPVYVPASTSTR